MTEWEAYQDGQKAGWDGEVTDRNPHYERLADDAPTRIQRRLWFQAWARGYGQAKRERELGLAG